MAKIDIENVEAILLERKIDQPTVTAILKDLEQAIEEEKADRADNKLPTEKWESVILINDPEGKLGSEWTGWVVTQKTGQDSGIILSKLRDACKEANEVCKKKKNIIQNFGELFQSLKPKFLKEKGLKVKTKEAVRVITVNGKTL